MAERERGDLKQSLEYFKHAFAVVNDSQADGDVNIRGMKKWSLTNIFTLMGLMSYWGGNFELTEHAVTYFSDSPGSELRRAPSMDPYTYSLVRFASLESDLRTNRHACSIYHQGTASKLPFLAMNSSRLRVGYFSFDWRDHPVCA